MTWLVIAVLSLESRPDANCLEGLKPHEPAEAFPASFVLMFRIRSVERVKVLVSEADAGIADLEADDRGGVLAEQIFVALHDYRDTMPPIGIRVLNCLKRVHYRLEQRKERLPFRKLCLPDLPPEVGSKHSWLQGCDLVHRIRPICNLIHLRSACLERRNAIATSKQFQLRKTLSSSRKSLACIRKRTKANADLHVCVEAISPLPA